MAQVTGRVCSPKKLANKTFSGCFSPNAMTDLVARSGSFLKVLEDARRFAAFPRPVLIRGERGTGKELIARFIHDQSDRRDRPFVPINCAAYDDELVNAEIYGHEKGAFTGADRMRTGKFEQANGGTLFMDEIGNMSMPFQEKILRVVEYQEFERVRGSERVKVDVRIISATNASLEELMEENLFRRDLYDRLTFAEIRIPPLRHRKEDIPELIVHFVRRLHQEIPNLLEKTFRKDTVEAMREYYWPGNVRELKNIVERVYLYGPEQVITPSALPSEITGSTIGGNSFHEKVEDFKRQLIMAKLVECGNNQRTAAQELGMTYDQFRHYYKKYCGLKKAAST